MPDFFSEDVWGYFVVLTRGDFSNRLLLIDGSIAQKWKEKMGRKVKVRTTSANM